MRVLMVHSYYSGRFPSGENIAVEQQATALAQAGVEVVQLSRHTDRESRSPLFSLTSAAHAITGLDTKNVLAEVRAFAPDVVNVHNLSPNFGTRWIKKLDVPSILTLHNFRFTCANGLLFQGGAVCLKCVTGSPFNATLHGCYQSSQIRSLPWSIGHATGGSFGAILGGADAIVAQSPRVANLLAERSIERSRIHLIPGFVENVHAGSTQVPAEARYVFVGRDTPEKGLSQLLSIWPSDPQLDVIGAQRLEFVPRTASARVVFHGHVDRTQLRQSLPSYTALIFPGLVWEGAIPLVVREALEAGVPVIAREGSGAADWVKEVSCGFVYDETVGSSLQASLDAVSTEGPKLRAHCRETFVSQLSRPAWTRSWRAMLETLL